MPPGSAGNGLSDVAEVAPDEQVIPLQTPTSAIEDDVAIACHKMRTPLTSAMGFVQLCLRDAQRSGDAAHVRNLETAEQQLRRLAEILEDLALRNGGR